MPRTEGSGTHYNTSVKSSSGSSSSTNYVKLASQHSSNESRQSELDSRDVISSSDRDTSHADESPSEYRAKVEAKNTVQSSESTQSSSTPTIRAATADEIKQQNATPSPIKPDYMINTVSKDEITQSESSVSGWSAFDSVKDKRSITQVLKDTQESKVESVSEKMGDFEFWSVDVPYVGKVQPSKAIANTLENAGQSIIDYANVDRSKQDGVNYPLEPVVDVALKTVGGGVQSVGYILGGAEPLVRNYNVAPDIAIGAAAMTGYNLIEGAKNDPLQFASDMIIGAYVGGKISAKMPKLETASVLEMESATSFKPIKYGYSLTTSEGTPLATYVKGKGINLGAGAAPEALIEGKQITAFSNTELAMFKKTLGSIDNAELEYFNSGEAIARIAYDTKKTIIDPDTFEIYSKNIPNSAKSVVKDAIVEYNEGLEVYGSNIQKQQAGTYFTREVKDIEVKVSDPQSFVQSLETKLTAKSIEYEIVDAETSTPKVYFFEDGVKTKGVEIFPLKDTGEAITGYRPKNEIAYNFDMQKPVSVEGVDTLRLSEQMARKLEGSTTFKDNVIQPKHEGRVKDVRDLIEGGVGYHNEILNPLQKISYKDAIIKYTQESVERYPSIRDSPIVDFIANEKKIPSKIEVENLLKNMDNHADTGLFSGESELLFSKNTRSSISSLKSNLVSSEINSLIRGSIYSSMIGGSVPGSSIMAASNIGSSIKPVPSVNPSSLISGIVPKIKGGGLGGDYPSDIKTPKPDYPSILSGGTFENTDVFNSISKPEKRIKIPDIEINFDGKRPMLKDSVNIKRGTRKNKFGDMNKILFGK